MRRLIGLEAAGMVPLAALLLGAAAAEEEDAPVARPYATTEQRAPCDAFDAERRPWFGDTHVHTTFSQDASTQGTRTTPRQAYAFARGEKLGIQPWSEDGTAQRQIQLARSLDFAVVTDHAEQFGEVHICKTPGAPGHDSAVCLLYRTLPRAAFFVMNARYSMLDGRWGFCGDDDVHCLAAARTVWQEIQDAAEGSYDRSPACRFTSFVGYEWTASRDAGKNLHRNVIFRNEIVPELPISVMETGAGAAELWRQLGAACVDEAAGCEVLTIPHNSNLDGGLMFTSAEQVGGEIGAEEAAQRQRWEPLVEIMQHKGDSECLLSGDTTDEACGFEKLPYDSFTGRFNPFGENAGPQPGQFVREALKRGLSLEAQLGANPFKYGIVASTDTHLGAPGLVAERDHPGHGGAGDPATEELPPGLVDNVEFGGGGLAVLWAEENSRDALFAAMLRKEAYGTSGSRPVVRFFGGWQYPEALCEEPDFVAKGYVGGVPMGGDLPSAPGPGAPSFAVSALRDPGDANGTGSALQRIQIVKGWSDGGALHERVVDIAGGPNDAGVDLTTCEPHGAGAASLCSVWSDPDFDPKQRAFYYARVLENPTCRWSQWACLEAGVRCEDPASIGSGFEPCCAPEHRPTIQERAWTSPIWYTP